MGQSKNAFFDSREADHADTLPVVAKRSIYNIRTEHLQLMQQIEDGFGEITPEIGAQLAISEKELQEKAVSYGYVIRQYDSEVDQIKQEMDRLKKMLDSKEKIKEELKERIKGAMIEFGITKIDHANLKLSIGTSKSVIVTEGAKIPKMFQVSKTTVTADKKALKIVLEAGQTFDGITLSENKNLQIK